MSQFTTVAVYLAVGTLGGLLASQLKVSGGTLIGAMLAVLLYKVFVDKDGALPQGYTLAVQILVGVMVGAGYTPAIGSLFVKNIAPIIASTFFLMATGLLVSVILLKTGILDIPTAYLGTSPGAMSALISLASEFQANPPIVAAFHFFRVVFIIVTAPLIFHLLRNWFPLSGGQ